MTRMLQILLGIFLSGFGIAYSFVLFNTPYKLVGQVLIVISIIGMVYGLYLASKEKKQ